MRIKKEQFVFLLLIAFFIFSACSSNQIQNRKALSKNYTNTQVSYFDLNSNGYIEKEEIATIYGTPLSVRQCTSFGYEIWNYSNFTIMFNKKGYAVQPKTNTELYYDEDTRYNTIKKENKKSTASYPYCAENDTCYGDISENTGRPKTVHVKGYYRSDGTYVRGHYRSAPRKK